MAFILKRTISSIVYSRNLIAPVISRSFTYRTLNIDPRADNKQNSDGQWRLEQTPVVEVHDPVIICDGGSGPLGHPMQYLRMNGPNGGVNKCQYCGQQYKYIPKH